MAHKGPKHQKPHRNKYATGFDESHKAARDNRRAKYVSRSVTEAAHSKQRRANYYGGKRV